MTAEPVGLELPYRHERQGRTRLAALGLIAGLGALYYAVRHEMPMFFLVAIGLCCFGAAYLLIFGRRWGVSVDRRALAFWAGRERGVFPLSQIERVDFEHWAEGARVTVHLSDGGQLDIPEDSLPDPRMLARALKAAGVTVT